MGLLGVEGPLAEELLSSEMETELTNLRAGLDDVLGSGSLLDDSSLFSRCLLVMVMLASLVLLLLLLVGL